MSTSSSIVQQFVSGLKSRNRNVQNSAAQDLFLYVKTELREMSQDELVRFFDDFNHQIFSMVMSSDTNEKKGGVLAISMYWEAASAACLNMTPFNPLYVFLGAGLFTCWELFNFLPLLAVSSTHLISLSESLSFNAY